MLCRGKSLNFDITRFTEHLLRYGNLSRASIFETAKKLQKGY